MAEANQVIGIYLHLGTANWVNADRSPFVTDRAELDQVVETRGNGIAPVNKGLNGANGGGDSNGTSTPDVPRGHGHHH
jgi:hypothetical protein